MRPRPPDLWLFATEPLAAHVPLLDLSPELARHGIAMTDAASRADVLLGDGAGPPDLPRVRVEPSWRAGCLRVTEETGRTTGRSRLARLVDRWGAHLDGPTIHAAMAALPDGLDAGALVARLMPCAPRGPRDAVRRWLALDALMNAVPPDPAPLAELLSDAVRHAAARPPRISIVINNYCYGDFLGAAIASALDQTRPAHEVVVIDDGSTDGSRDVIARFPQVRAVLKENGGQGSAFNAGFAAATGDLIVFLDADDRLLPDAIETLVEEPLDGLARLSYGLETIDSAGHPTGLFPMSRLAESGALRGPLLERGFLMMMPTSGNAFPRRTLERLLPMQEAPWRISADIYLAFGAAVLGEARHLDRPLGQYRLHGRNAHFATMGAEAPYAARKMRQRRQAFGDLAARLRSIDPEVHGRDADRLSSMAAPLSPPGYVGALVARVRAPRRPLSRPFLSIVGREIPPLGRLRCHLVQADPAAFGGSATWPVLAPGEVVPLESPRGRSLLGAGWRAVPGRGAEPEAPFAVLALRLPGPRADWTLRLATEGSGGSLGVWINGMRHETLPQGDDTRTLRIAGDVLECDETDGWRAGITLIPDGPAPAVTHVAAQRALPAFGAPVLPAGRTVRPSDAAGRRCLAEGWHWPDGFGARMAGPEAVLRLSVAGTGNHLLHLEAAPRPLMAASGGIALAHEVDASGAGLLLHLPADDIPASGILDVTLTASEDGPRPRLTALRLTRAGEGPVPGRLTSTADLGMVETEDGTILVPLPPGRSEGLLLLRFEGTPEDGGPTDATVLSGQIRATLRLAGPADALVAAAEGADRLDIRLPPGIRLDGLAVHPDRPRAQTPSDPLVRLDPTALAARAVMAAAWQEAEGDAIWLVADEGWLRLTRPGPGALRLFARVLTLPGTGQRLRIEAAKASATSSGTGVPETLTLELPPDLGPVFTLALSTDLLVDARLAGIGGGGLLGGALLDLRIEPIGGGSR